MKKGKVIVTNIHKGGTGKSTTVINTAAEAAHRGLRVAVIDGDTTQTCLNFFNNRNGEIERRQADGDFTSLPFIKSEYHSPDTNIKPMIVEMKKDYDLIFIDTAGGQSLLFKSVIQLADLILIPLQADLKAMMQLAPTMEVILGVQENIQLNPGWEDYEIPVKVLFNQAKPGTKAYRDAIDMVRETREQLGFCSTVIPDIQEHRNFGPFLSGLGLIDIKHPKRASYQLLLDEILEAVND